MSQNSEIVQSIYAAFGRGDVPFILKCLHEDVIWEYDSVDHGVPWLVPRRGRAQVGGFFETLSAIEFKRFEVASLLEGPNQVLGLVNLEAIVKETGRPVRDLEGHLFTFDAAGLITRMRHLCDTKQFYDAWRP